MDLDMLTLRGNEVGLRLQGEFLPTYPLVSLAQKQGIGC